MTGVLGSVGQSAFALLAEQIKKSRAESGGANAGGTAADSGASSLTAPRDPAEAYKFAAQFEDQLGQSHREALQLLSSTADSRAADMTVRACACPQPPTRSF